MTVVLVFVAVSQPTHVWIATMLLTASTAKFIQKLFHRLTRCRKSICRRVVQSNEEMTLSSPFLSAGSEQHAIV